MSPLPVDRPGKIIAVGLNYRDHAAESEASLPASPIMFAKWTTCLIASGDPILIPAGIDEVDWEAELAVVIGRTAKDVAVEDALSYVSGYTCMNDVSARRRQRDDQQWTPSKSFDTFGPIGPVVVPADRIPDPQDLQVISRVNGTVMQSSSTRDMIFTVAQLIAHASIGTTLEPGDILSTGTPSGVGAFRPDPIFLKDGDVVEIEVEGIGVLTNPVVQL
ncbi:fumarylacetoacetate hydrolase family protein [Nakamurella endophytica]|uniref:2-hydroxyhepta-2,4-diene-1,7-dioate isomerase n=1 Tax=Nakamurella endophytica TaxID=1748367 RepID=A0A917SX91_9ACTN|nr:fumarylacetoacetate hydrolase family protein [Nakamurella endophytica]GGL99423.1 2-hydroxyhepta-2,4-diene-1,7-dioate isomerase [Nakamurella endophytica]